MYDLVVRNGLLFDGSGLLPFRADLGITDGRIAAIGTLDGAQAAKDIDARGRYVTPGFIDMHSHADLSIVQYPDGESLLGQGITTAFCGQCGMGMAPVGAYWKSQGDDLFAFEAFMPFASVSSFPGMTPACRTEQLKLAYKDYFGVEMDWVTFGDYRRKLERQGIGVNLAMEVGLQQIRQQVLGLDSKRPASQAELEEMLRLVETSLDEGAFGLSIGFDYTPDMDAGEEELLALAQCVQKKGGILAAHTRNGKAGSPNWQHIDGIREFVELGRKTGAHVHISHIQPGFKVTPADQALVDASARRTLEILDDYRADGVNVTWDTLHPEAASFYYYPQLCSFLTYYILECGGKTAFRRRLDDKSYRRELAEKIRRGEHIVFPRLDENAPITACGNTAYLGRTVQELALQAGLPVPEAVLQILREDIETCIRPLRPWEQGMGTEIYWRRDDAVIGTDNPAFPYDYEGRRPELPTFRGTPEAYGGFIHFLERSAGIPFEKTVRKLTGNAAKILGLTDRGWLKPGMRADLLVLDRNKLHSNLNLIDPRQQPSGLDYVVVNGKIAVDHGSHTHVRSGQFLTRV